LISVSSLVGHFPQTPGSFPESDSLKHLSKGDSLITTELSHLASLRRRVRCYLKASSLTCLRLRAVLLASVTFDLASLDDHLCQT